MARQNIRLGFLVFLLVAFLSGLLHIPLRVWPLDRLSLSDEDVKFRPVSEP